MKRYLLILIIPIILSAQSDRIVGVVDNEAITLGEVDKRVRLSGLPVTEEMRRETLEAMIQTKLLRIAAERETLLVRDEEVESALEHTMNSLKERFPEEELFYAELERLNMTKEDLKNFYREDIESSMLVRMLIQKKFGDLSVSDIEALHFFNEYPDSIPDIPTTAKYLGVLIPIIPIEERLRETEKLLEKVSEKILDGEDFGKLAEIYSDDPITGRRGGVLGTMEIDDTDPQLRDIVEGEIRVMQKQGAVYLIKCDMRTESHISLKAIVFDLTPTAEDTITAKNLAEEIKADIDEGRSLSVDRRAVILSEAAEYLPLPPAFEYLCIDTTQIIKTADGLCVIRIFDKKARRRPLFEEVRENLKLFLQQRKTEEMLSSLLLRLEEEIFVENRI